MNKSRITAFISIAVIAAIFLSGCTTSKLQTEENKGSTSSTQDGTKKSDSDENNETDKTSENNSLSGTNKPSKEDLLKDMMDIPMEDFESVDLDGNTIKLSDYKGKIILLNFWATWCPPCREEMPMMQEVYEKYKDQDVVILTVNPTSVELRGGTDSKKAENQVRKFIKDSGFTFPVLLDKEDKAWDIYQQRGIPVNYVIDKQGIVRYGFSGAFQSKEQIEMLIENIRAIE